MMPYIIKGSVTTSKGSTYDTYLKSALGIAKVMTMRREEAKVFQAKREAAREKARLFGSSKRYQIVAI